MRGFGRSSAGFSGTGGAGVTLPARLSLPPPAPVPLTRCLTRSASPLAAGGALLVAAQYGQAEALAVLVDAGAAVNRRDSDGAVALGVAAFHGQEEAVARLLSLGADVDLVDNDGYTPLMWAAFRARRRTVEILLQAGADVQRASKEGNSALIYAAYSASALGRGADAEALVDVLLAAGADTTHCNATGSTAAQVAAQQGRDDLAARLSRS